MWCFSESSDALTKMVVINVHIYIHRQSSYSGLCENYIMCMQWLPILLYKSAYIIKLSLVPVVMITPIII